MAGALLAALPLVQGQLLAAVPAGIVGFLVVGAWAWGTHSGRTVGVAVGVAQLASLVGVFAVSQWPRGLIGAPWFDWLVVWLFLGVVCLVTLVADWIVHTGKARDGLGSRTYVVPVWQRPAAAAALTAVVIAACCGAVVVLEDNDGALRFAARDGEATPFPSTLRLISADECADGGSSGNCTAMFEVVSSDSATRATTVTRLVEHLRRLGWAPVAGEHFLLCLPRDRRDTAVDPALPMAVQGS